MATWFCFGCQKNIGDNQYCPYCGMHRLGDFGCDTVVKKPQGILSGFLASLLNPSIETVGIEKSRNEEPQKVKEPMFSEEECFLYGIHPEDEMYRKTMELNILSKNYKE